MNTAEKVGGASLVNQCEYICERFEVFFKLFASCHYAYSPSEPVNERDLLDLGKKLHVSIYQ